MKKILVLCISALLVLVGCSTSASTPEEALKKAVETATTSAQTIDVIVATVLTTVDGDVSFDNFGKIITEGNESFSGMVTLKALIDKDYEDVTIYASEGAYYLELNDAKTKVQLDELLKLGLIDFTQVDALLGDFTEVTTEGNVHTFVKEADSIDGVVEFATYAHLNELKVVSTSMKQTLTVEKDSLTKNEIYVTAVYADKDGVEYPVTQTITLKYSAGSKVEMPDFSSFN